MVIDEATRRWASIATHNVAIHDAQSKALVTPYVTVTTSGGSLSGDDASFNYVSLAKPIVLSAKTTYILAATESRTRWLQAPKNVSPDYGIDPASLHCAFHFDSTQLIFPDTTYAANDPALIEPNFIGAAGP